MAEIKSTAKNDNSVLLHSAMELYFKYGVKSVSMDDIARLMGISKKTIYNLVKNKGDLVHTVVSTFIELEHVTIDEISRDAENSVHQMVALARQVIKSLKHMKPNFSYDLQKYHKKTWQYVEEKHFSFVERIIRDNLERGIKEGLYRSELDPYIISKLYLGIIQKTITDDFTSLPDIKMTNLYETVILYHLNGIVNEKGRMELKKYLKNKES